MTFIKNFIIILAVSLTAAPVAVQAVEAQSSQTYSECRSLDQRKQSRSRHPQEALRNLGFTGFCIDDGQDPDVVESAKRGLNNINYALPFRGSSFPLALRPKFDEILAQIAPARSDTIDTSTAIGAYEVYGSLPSPRSRPGVPLGPVTIPVANVGDSISNYKGAVGGQTNCFLCHAGVVAGSLHAGAMNTQLDQLNLSVALAGVLLASPALLEENTLQSQLGSPTAAIERQVFDTYLNRTRRIYLPTFSQSRAKGDNLGPFAVWRTFARYEGVGIEAIPATTTAQLDSLFAGVDLPTVDSNAWWTYKYKESIYRFDDRSPDFSKHFATTFNQPGPDSNANHDEQVQIMDDVLAYIRQLPSPSYDRKIKWRRAARGAELFHGAEPIAAGGYLSCSGCHGSYISEPDRYEVFYDADTGVVDVGTDSAYSDFLMTTGAAIADPISDHLVRYFNGDQSYRIQTPENSGYQPPPLDGSWASPPYFHNGSVPTLHAVLQSGTRPEYWQRSIHPDAYDHRKAGLRYRSLTARQVEALQREASIAHPFSAETQLYRRVYDTTAFGKSNNGHAFGDAMNRRERADVIEFLKSLYDRQQ